MQLAVSAQSLSMADSPRPRFGTTKRVVCFCQGDGAVQPWLNPCRTGQELWTQLGMLGVDVPAAECQGL